MYSQRTSAHHGTQLATATPVHVGRRTIAVQTDIVFEHDGKLVSGTLHTQAVISG